jgi:hypothetical protein
MPERLACLLVGLIYWEGGRRATGKKVVWITYEGVYQWDHQLSGQ